MAQRQAGQEHSQARGVSTSCGGLTLAVLALEEWKLSAKPQAPPEDARGARPRDQMPLPIWMVR